MTICTERSLLQELDGPAVLVDNPDGSCPFLFVCDHASNRIPAALGTLGLGDEALESHAAWDPGAYSLATQLARLLDATLVSSGFSRLVYDVNRPPDSPQAIRAASEIYDIPGNLDLSEAKRGARAKAVYAPFHSKITELIDARMARGQPTVLVTLHSFTPVYHGQTRNVELGILHDRDARLADAVLDIASRFTTLKTERNQPYGPDDGVTHTLAKHAIPRGLLNAMIEVRNDLIASEAGQSAIADMLSAMLPGALDKIGAGDAGTSQPGVNNAPSD